ncbi:MAG: hypothetical protein C0623_09260 [Desulfuromonas sp.]|nr:MAG: hypothetical protein C0623_09260 [Desulfuromonas sp.]
MSNPGKFNLKIRDYIASPDRKKEYNEQHFGEAARHYDFATRAMSLGRDMAWKRALIELLPAAEKPVCLDLACGTGDIAFMLAEKYPAGRIIGLDLTEPMLELARQRNRFESVEFIKADMVETGLDDASVEIVTGSYAVRNAPDLKEAFAEIHRLLKPGGVVALLDFSKPANGVFQRLQYTILKYWCGLWGFILHGNAEVHSYIAASLKEYPDRDALRELLDECGLSVKVARRFYFGTLELLVLEKAGNAYINGATSGASGDHRERI